MPPARPRLPASSLLDYGVIGDLTTAALVSRDGGLDWLCLPRLDSPAVFAALLDDERGGRFRVAPLGAYESAQSYLPDTNILKTDFATPTGHARLTAFMPIEEIDHEEYASQEVHLLLEALDGRIETMAEFHPRFNYGLAHTGLRSGPFGIMAAATNQHLAFAADVPFRVEDDTATANWVATAPQRFRFVLRYGTPFVRPVSQYRTDEKLQETGAYWRSWTKRGTYEGPAAPVVRRSALALKLLTYAPTGALAAAVTTSLPEVPGGERNWDYRFSWVRDSAFTMQVLHALGYSREARRYLRWLRRLLRGAASIESIRVGYGLEGETDAAELELGHLRGYLDSKPVRVGNAAFGQFQLDIYGSLQGALYEAYRRPGGMPDEAWRTARAVADFVAEHWEEPDHGIWEIRGRKRRYTHSALMSWVALDRAIQAARDREHPEYEGRWGPAREQVRQTILQDGWNPARKAFVQSFGSDHLDASLLLIPIVGFLPAEDPRVLSTLDAVQSELGRGPLVYRYRAPDGLDGAEGAFLICSFWMVHALALAGRTGEARARFDQLSRLAGPLGLFSEEVDPETGQALGNFPQALTHLSHIAAALALEAGPSLEEPVPPQQRAR